MQSLHGLPDNNAGVATLAKPHLSSDANATSSEACHPQPCSFSSPCYSQPASVPTLAKNPFHTHLRCVGPRCNKPHAQDVLRKSQGARLVLAATCSSGAHTLRAALGVRAAQCALWGAAGSAAACSITCVGASVGGDSLALVPQLRLAAAGRVQRIVHVALDVLLAHVLPRGRLHLQAAAPFAPARLTSSGGGPGACRRTCAACAPMHADCWQGCPQCITTPRLCRGDRKHVHC
jgi:hypothetical protein